jgi:hypothetical protein
MAKLRRALGVSFAGGPRRRAIGVFAALLVTCCGRALALDLPDPASGYVSKNFTVQDGLLSNNVSTV